MLILGLGDRAMARKIHFPCSSPMFLSTTRSLSPGVSSEGAPPVPIPNTEVKPLSADGSAALRRVRVGRRQD